MPPRRSTRASAGDAKTQKPANVAETKEPAKTKKATTASNSKSPSATRADGQNVASSSSLKRPPSAEPNSDDKPPAESAAPKKSRRKATAGGEDESPAAPRGNKDFDILAFEGFPKNVDIPKDLSFPDTPRPAGSIRVSSWNIVSLKSAEPKGLVRYIEAEDADIVFFSETKVNEVPSFFQSSRYPHQAWGIGATKSYAGVALLSKIKPLAIHKGLPTAMPGDYDTKSRCLTAEFPGCYVVGTYCVNAGEGLKSMDTKKAWNEALSRHLCELDAKKPVIWTGDLNVVYDSDDLSRASAKWNKSAGYTQIECDHHRAFLEGRLEYLSGAGQKPFSDVWKEKHPDAKGHFTYYGWRGQCRIKGSGWRIDTFITSQRIRDQCQRCEIRHEVYGASDHVPIIADFDAALFTDAAK
ncbi:unnamed protein product [Parajaminaea phylloscopi]